VTDLLAALCLAVVIEGLLYAAFPNQMKRMLARLEALPASTIRAVALARAAIALVLLWFIRR